MLRNFDLNNRYQVNSSSEYDAFMDTLYENYF